MESPTTKKYLHPIKRIALCAALSLTGYGFSSTAMAVGGTPAYEVEPASFQWIDASQLAPTTSMPIGFNFVFYGVTHTSLTISSTGFLKLGSNVATPNNIIAPFWSSEFYTSPNERIYMRADGAAPNRRLTISWINLAYRTPFDPDCGYCEPGVFGSVSFQATLHEGSNDIVYRYLDTIANDEGLSQDVDNGKTAWVGVRNPDDTGGTVYSDNQAVIFSGTALRVFMGSNLSPIANAGADQVANEGASVTLNGSGSSDATGIATFAWTQYDSSNMPVTMDTPNAATTTFVAPQVTYSPSVSLGFQLVVTDNKRAYTVDTTRVEVRDLNAQPTVNAGADVTVNPGAAVTLTATASDSDGTIARYIWAQQSGTAVTFTGGGTAVIGFTAPTTPGALTFAVRVVDNNGAEAVDTVAVTVRDAPTANAGVDQTVKQKTTVTLDGSASTGNLASVQWRQVAGKGVSLKNPKSMWATFTAPSTTQPIALTFEIAVKDTNGVTATDRVVVTVTK